MPKNTITFSPIITGTMRLGEWGAKLPTADLEKFIQASIDLGFTDFDHADIYGHYTTEAEFGKVLKQQPSLRQQLQVTTKCGIHLVTPNRPSIRLKAYEATRSHILHSVDNSLKELGTDYLDLYLIHRPDYLLDPHEVAEAFETVRKAGKVLHFGVSNFSASQFDLLNTFTPLVTNQIEVSLLHLAPFDDGTLDQCLKHGIAPTAWSPFGGGAIFSKQTDDPRVSRIQKTGKAIAERYNTSLDQILLAWLLKHPAGIIPVIGTTKIERLMSAKKALAIKLTQEEWYELWQASTGVEIP